MLTGRGGTFCAGADLEIVGSMTPTEFRWRQRKYWNRVFSEFEDIQKLTIADLTKAAVKTVHPAGVVWIIVGDRAKIEAKIRELGYSEITVIDGDGNVIR